MSDHPTQHPSLAFTLGVEAQRLRVLARKLEDLKHNYERTNTEQVRDEVLLQELVVHRAVVQQKVRALELQYKAQRVRRAE